MDALSRRGEAVRRGVPWGLSALLLAPSALWVLRDRSVWSWDPAFYGMGTVDLWHALTTMPARWMGEMMHVFSAKAPAIAWTGQFFVPLGVPLGSVERALLASVLIAQLGTLLLIFDIGRRVHPASVGPAALGTLFLGASPLFVGLSHYYLVEPLQAFAIAYVYWIAASAQSTPPLLASAHLVIAGALGLAAKISTPAFMFAPGALAAYRVLRSWSSRGAVARARAADAVAALAAVVTVALCAGWYLRNGAATLAFARMSAASDVALLYGRQDTVARKLVHWTGELGRTFLAPEATWLLAFAVVGGAVAARLARRDAVPASRGRAPWALLVAALLQIGVVLAVLSRTVNEDSRYLLALAPSLAVVVVVLASAPLARPWRGAIAVALVVQWGLVQARDLGALPRGPRYWENPPSDSAGRVREIADVVGATCGDPAAGSIMAAVDLEWLNSWTLRFYSAKRHLNGGPRCDYTFLGLAEKDVDVAWERLVRARPPFVVTLDAAALPDPPDELNRVSLPVLRRLQADPGFALEPYSSPLHVLVFRRIEGGAMVPVSR